MRDYKEQVEAAYLRSQRQGELMRNRAMERSAHQDRRNRLRAENEQPAEGNFRGALSQYEIPESYRPMNRDYVQQPGGPHRGKGPRNYKPSSERIRERICDLLTEDPYLDASNIDVSVHDTEVTLSGFVEDKFSKRLAEHLAENIPVVTNVENRIRVKPYM